MSVKSTHLIDVFKLMCILTGSGGSHFVVMAINDGLITHCACMCDGKGDFDVPGRDTYNNTAAALATIIPELNDSVYYCFIIVEPNVSESSHTSGCCALCLCVWDGARGQTSQSVDVGAVRRAHALLLPVTTAHSLSVFLLLGSVLPLSGRVTFLRRRIPLCFWCTSTLGVCAFSVSVWFCEGNVFIYVALHNGEVKPA